MAQGDIQLSTIKLPGMGSQRAYTIENEHGVKFTVPITGIRNFDDTLTATIPNGQSRSQILDGSLYAGMIIHVPAAMAANRYIGVAVRNPVDGNYALLRDDVATIVVAQTTTRPGAYAFPADFFASCKFQLVLLTNASAEVAAAAELQIGVTLKA